MGTLSLIWASNLTHSKCKSVSLQTRNSVPCKLSNSPRCKDRLPHIPRRSTWFSITLLSGRSPGSTIPQKHLRSNSPDREVNAYTYITGSEKGPPMVAHIPVVMVYNY